MSCQIPFRKTSFLYLLGCQSLVVLNDNITQFMLLGLAASILTAEETSTAISLINFLLVLPYIIFAPLAGWTADRFTKSSVLRWGSGAQIIGVLIIIAGISFHQIYLLYLGFTWLAIQSTFFSPAKQGVLKELVGGPRLGMAVGVMQLLTVNSILFGNLVGGQLFEGFRAWTDSTWAGAGYTCGVVAMLALASWILSFAIGKTTNQKKVPLSAKILITHFHDLIYLWKTPGLRLPALGIAWAWGLGQLMTLILMNIGKIVAPDNTASTTGFFLLAMGVGVMAGSGLISFISRRHIETGFIPLGGLGSALAILFLAWAVPNSPFFFASLFLLGIFIGFFAVPQTALLQNRSPEHERGRVIAASNLLNNIGFVLFIGFQWLLGSVFALSPTLQLFIAILPAVGVSIFVIWHMPETLFRLAVRNLFRLIYRVKVKGLENIPEEGGVLLISNHVSYVDAIILTIACPRPVRFMSFDRLSRVPLLGFILRLAGTIPVSPTRAKAAIADAATALQAGEVVCIFPEGQLTRRGILQAIQGGFALIARKADAPVVPVYLDGLWGSIFSFYQDKYFFKKPQKVPYAVSVQFAKTMKETTPDFARQHLLDLGEEAFRSRPIFSRHLGDVAAESLASKPKQEIITDCTLKPRKMKAGFLLAIACVIAKKIKKEIPEKRVGIVLPPGIGGQLTNLAVSLAGKTPVNLNFTMGAQGLTSCLEQAGVKTIISAEGMKSKAPHFPWTENFWDISEIIKNISKPQVFFFIGLIRTLPWSMVRPLVGTPKRGGDEEAGLLFSSGSTGNPKGVILTHRNILCNAVQIAECGILPEGEVLLASLPLFHSFGFTVTIWFPFIYNLPIVTVPSPLEIKKIADVIEKFSVTFMVGTPTFLRPYLQKIEPTKLASLKGVVAGAEKTPAGFAELWENKFSSKYLEGYGLTETSPVISVNVPNPPTPKTGTAKEQVSQRTGSTGRMVPGISARIRHMDTGELLPISEVGILEVKGGNIFTGYLNDRERTLACLHDGWFSTGDLARFDSDGFLFIEGRLSRFSKIAGEMVPHGKVEQEIVQAYGLEESEQHHFAVAARPDPQKGESLVLLTTEEIDRKDLQEKLAARGIANLWIPKIIVKVEAIPCLPTGKLDLKACNTLANRE